LDEIEEWLEYHRPPEWMTSTKLQRFPYVPQVGDEVRTLWLILSLVNVWGFLFFSLFALYFNPRKSTIFASAKSFDNFRQCLGNFFAEARNEITLNSFGNYFGTLRHSRRQL
jgi:hypothetical protein